MAPATSGVSRSLKAHRTTGYTKVTLTPTRNSVLFPAMFDPLMMRTRAPAAQQKVVMNTASPGEQRVAQTLRLETGRRCPTARGKRSSGHSKLYAARAHNASISPRPPSSPKHFLHC